MDLSRRRSEAASVYQQSVTPIRGQIDPRLLPKQKDSHGRNNNATLKSGGGSIAQTAPEDIEMKKFYPEEYFRRSGYAFNTT